MDGGWRGRRRDSATTLSYTAVQRLLSRLASRSASAAALYQASTARPTALVLGAADTGVAKVRIALAATIVRNNRFGSAFFTPRYCTRVTLTVPCA